MALPQEAQEHNILYSKKELPYNLKTLLWPIKKELQSSIQTNKDWLYSILPYAPSNLSIEESIDRYIENFNDYDVFSDMKSRSEKDYMEREHQKSFAKAYFVPLLNKVLEFCHKKWYIDMAQAMAYNIKDETGQWPEWEWLEVYQDEIHYISPKYLEWEEYKWEAHEKRREYEYNWLIREYKKVWNLEEVTKQWRNIGIQLFNIITWDLLSTDDDKSWYEAIGAIMFLEKFIPHEFKFMQIARDKLFPWLNKKEKHYIDDHIIHDEEFHYQDIIKWLNHMNLNEEEKASIVNGIHKIYMWREFMFSAFANHIKPSTITKILNIPIIQYIKKYWIAASIVLWISIMWDTNISNDDFYQVSNIKQYEEKIAKENWVREEYSSWKSTNFVMMDYIWYESLREAIKDQKWVDIWPYSL